MEYICRANKHPKFAREVKLDPSLDRSSEKPESFGLHGTPYWDAFRSEANTNSKPAFSIIYEKAKPTFLMGSNRSDRVDESPRYQGGLSFLRRCLRLDVSRCI